VYSEGQAPHPVYGKEKGRLDRRGKGFNEKKRESQRSAFGRENSFAEGNDGTPRLRREPSTAGKKEKDNDMGAVERKRRKIL